MFTKGGQDQAAAHPRVATPSKSEALAGTREGKRKVAVFVAHGMGQQVPFETMDTVATGLKAIVERTKDKPLAAPVRARTCRVGGEKLQRLEMDLTDERDRPLEVHIYEGYWAPITEGQVNIRDVMSFLLRGGINGVRNAGNNFSRWMFGGPVDFGKRPRTGRRLLLALAVVLSVVVMNFIVTVMLADRLAARGGAAAVYDDTLAGLTTLIAGWVILSVVAGVWLLRMHNRKGGGWATPPRPSAAPTQQSIRALAGFLKLWLACTIALGVIALLALAGSPIVDRLGLSFLNAAWVWIALLAVSWVIRGIMIQFPGDVAAYVSTHTLDRFQEIRTKIKERVNSVAKAIYASDEYEGVVWVGHSLGSVVVYDALNTIITDDLLDGQPRRTVARTKLLLTFGSPLDKIAFIFGAQLADARTRDALAASFQPLILDYDKFRSIPWVNIWSPADIISGHLDFFDDPKRADKRMVENVIDEHATTPLMAHVEYWQNDLLFERLYEGIARQDVALAATRPPA